MRAIDLYAARTLRRTPGFTAIAILALAHLLRGLLYGISPFDPVTFAAAAIGLVAAAACASWIPARRAARIDPIEAMRSE